MPENRNIEVKIRKKSADIPLPRYETEGAAGLDLRAFLPEGPRIIPPGGRGRISTGLFLEIPPGFEAQVRPRSGLAARYGITVLNSPGTVDSDYRGELEIILVNLGDEGFAVNNGERIAQLVIAPVSRAFLVETGELSLSKRGAGGFGSTGK